MTPDDPRHGHHAGYMAHRAAHEDPCDPCATAHRRYTKLAKIRLARGIRNRIPLGDEAWRVLHNSPLLVIAKQAGLAETNLRRIHDKGPKAIVLRSTRDAILAVHTWTNVGIQRRLRALAAIGYCMSDLAPMVPCHPEPLVRIARRNRPPQYVNRHIAHGVIAAYDQLHMQPAPASRKTNRRRSTSAKYRWHPPLAWDDIDHDPRPATRWRTPKDREIDQIVVARILGGERLPANEAERYEVMRLWLASGKSERSLCRYQGWGEGRYTPQHAAEVAAAASSPTPTPDTATSPNVAHPAPTGRAA